MPDEPNVSHRTPGQRLQVRVDLIALIAVLVLLGTMALGLFWWQHWLTERDTRNHSWWVHHSVPLRSNETVERVVVGQMVYHGVPYDAWARAETPHTVVIRSLRAVGCGDPVSFSGLVNQDDLASIRALEGHSLDGVEARVMLAPQAGESMDPPCPNLVVVDGRWTFEGKAIAVLNPSLEPGPSWRRRPGF